MSDSLRAQRTTGRFAPPSRSHATHTDAHALAFCPLGPIVVALDASRIEGVWDRQGRRDDRGDAEEVDLAALLKLDLETPDDAGRRRLQCWLGDHDLTIVVSREVFIEYSTGEALELPLFLRGLVVLGVNRMVPFRRQFAFELDLATLLHAHGSGLVGR